MLCTSVVLKLYIYIYKSEIFTAHGFGGICFAEWEWCKSDETQQELFGYKLVKVVVHLLQVFGIVGNPAEITY